MTSLVFLAAVLALAAPTAARTIRPAVDVQLEGLTPLRDDAAFVVSPENGCSSVDYRITTNDPAGPAGTTMELVISECDNIPSAVTLSCAVFG